VRGKVTSVYRYFDAGGRLLYVGVTARGIRRSREHAESKEWWPFAVGCWIEHFPTRLEALAHERELIEKFCPPFNTQHNPKKRAAHELWMKAIRGDAPRLTPAMLRALPPVDTPSIRQPRKRARWLAMSEEERNVRRRRREWHAMSREDQRRTPCIACGVRPNSGRPECDVCHPPRVVDVPPPPTRKPDRPERRDKQVRGARRQRPIPPPPPELVEITVGTPYERPQGAITAGDEAGEAGDDVGASGDRR
jgi:hypothetical protein